MALSEETKERLRTLRRDLIERTGPQIREFERITNEIDLTGISIQDLRSLLNPQFIQGVNLNEIDTSGSFTSTDMNRIAPGSLDVQELKSKLVNISLLQGQVTDIVDTQSGTVAVLNQLRNNADIEDVVETKTKSQGTNLQFINRARTIDRQSVENKPIKSRFLEE